MGEPWELSEEWVQERRVDRASLLLQADWLDQPDEARRTVVVRDADTGAFVFVPCERTQSFIRAVALSRDGRHMAYFVHSFSAVRHLYVRTLADASEVRYEPAPSGLDVSAAFSPDGRGLAVLAAADVRGDDGIVEGRLDVWVLELATGARRRMWSGPGSTPAESTVGWSPDGQYIVLAHIDGDEQSTVTVLDSVHGRVVGQFTGTETLACPQGRWLNDRELLLFPEDVDYEETSLEPTIAVDVATGEMRRLDPTQWLPYGTCAVLGDRLIGSFAPDSIGTTDLDGSDQQALLVHPPTVTVRLIDVAPTG